VKVVTKRPAQNVAPVESNNCAGFLVVYHGEGMMALTIGKY
jgi:hypothetical protein